MESSMASKEHLEVLLQEVGVWNRWRSEQPETLQLDFSRADLIDANLSRADLRKADLSWVKFSRANLREADLRKARLIGASLTDADLGKADLSGAKLAGAILSGAHLRGAKLIGADLTSAGLSRAQLEGVNLSGADLRGANLTGAHLKGANLTGVKLGGAGLGGADLSRAKLNGADLTKARCKWTMFVDVDLSAVKGLDDVRHLGPSSISIETIFISKGKIPAEFLRNAGVPEYFITYICSIAEWPVQFYSCFITYSSKDKEFAERLHADLRAKGVRVWFALHDMPIGAHIRPTIDEWIRVSDKLLLVLSETSVSSQWVEQEVETALAKEEELGREVLFPVRLDDTILEIKSGWPALVKRTRHIGNFTRWKEHDSYASAFDRLLRDLMAGV
jgi:uncharacterized protein YjbI with pentapeptide repeats